MAKGGGIKAGNTGTGGGDTGWTSGGSAAVRSAETEQAAARAAYEAGTGSIGAVRAANDALAAAHYDSPASVQSRELATAINAHGAKLPGGMQVSARSHVADADGKKIYTVEATGKILGTSHTVSRTLSGPSDHASVIAGMQKELGAKAKEAKAKSKFQPERIR